MKTYNLLIESKLEELINTLNEEVFNFKGLDDDAKDRIFSIFKDSYEKSLGTSWSKDKFLSRANNWEFYGTEKGFVAVRPQRSGLYKLVGVAGNMRDILKGLNELESKNVPVWGMVSSDIKSMAEKKGFKTPSKLMLKMIYKFIPKSVFGGVDTQINKDGSITLKYSDVGDAKKYFIGNDKYFQKIKKDIMPSLKDKLKLFEDITAGRMIVYHRTESYKEVPKGVAADGWRIGHGDYYGPGIYTNYKFEGTQTSYSKNYGDIIIESRVLNLKDFLILDKEPAKKVYGTDYSVESQLKKILKGKWNTYKNTEEVRTLITKMKDWPEKPGEIYKKFYDSSKKDVVPYFRGVVYDGYRDAYTCIIYDRNNVEPLRYSLDDGKTWTLINNKNILKRIKSGKFKTKNLRNIHLMNKVGLEKLEDIDVNDIKKLPKNELDYFIDKVSDISQYISSDIYNVLPKDKKQSYIEKKVEKGYEISDEHYEDASDELKKLYIKKIAEKGHPLTDQQYEDASDELRKLYIENRVKDGFYLTDQQYKNTSDELKKFYIENMAKSSYNLPNELYKDASDELKKLYIEKRVEKGYDLTDQQYEDASDELRKLYIEKRVKDGFYLTNEQYKDVFDELKKLYIEKRVEKGYEISDQQYEDASDELKKFYIEKMVEIGYTLSDQQYEDSSDELKKLYIEKITERGFLLSIQQYKNSSDELKKFYIEKTVENGNFLTNRQYNDSSDELRKLYIEKRVENGYHLGDQQYNNSSDELKKLYVEKTVENGGFLTNQQLQDSSEELKKFYIEKKKNT